MGAKSESTLTARGVLLDQFGFEKRWIRWEKPVRIVDAKPRRDGDHQLGWVHAYDGPYGASPKPVRWISVTNFTRYYREAPNHSDRSTS